MLLTSQSLLIIGSVSLRNNYLLLNEMRPIQLKGHIYISSILTMYLRIYFKYLTLCFEIYKENDLVLLSSFFFTFAPLMELSLFLCNIYV